MLASGAAGAQELDGFAPEPGHGDIALSVSFDHYDRFWVGEQKVEEPALGRVESNSVSLWWRHGLNERWTLIASLPHVDVEGDGTARLADSGLQDASVLVQVRLWRRDRGSVRHSIVVGAGLRSPVENYLANAPISIGDGSIDTLLRAVYLRQAGRWYLSGQLGYDLRSDDPPNGFPLALTAGYDLGSATLSATVQQLVADGGTDIGDPGFTFPSNREELQRLSLKVWSRINPRLGWSAGVFTTLDGRNTGDTDGAFGGLVYSY